jgi:hypothetical protein
MQSASRLCNDRDGCVIDVKQQHAGEIWITVARRPTRPVALPHRALRLAVVAAAARAAELDIDAASDDFRGPFPVRAAAPAPFARARET